LQCGVATPFGSVLRTEICAAIDKPATISDIIRRFSKFDPEPKGSNGRQTSSQSLFCERAKATSR